MGESGADARRALGQQGRSAGESTEMPPNSGVVGGPLVGVWCVDGGSNQVFQQNENAQWTRDWWRRIAVAERAWKPAQPSSSLTCL
jgi:hypothetical protein